MSSSYCMLVVLLLLLLLRVAKSASVMAPDVKLVNGAVDELLSKMTLEDGFPVEDFSRGMVLIDERSGYPQQAEFKASSGRLEGLSVGLKRNGDAILSLDSGELVIPLILPTLQLRYQQYLFKYGFMTYVGGFSLRFEKSLGTGVLGLRREGDRRCTVTVLRASLDSFPAPSLRGLDRPPALVGVASQLGGVALDVFVRSSSRLEGLLSKGLEAAVGAPASSSALCNLFPQ